MLLKEQLKLEIIVNLGGEKEWQKQTPRWRICEETKRQKDR